MKNLPVQPNKNNSSIFYVKSVRAKNSKHIPGSHTQESIPITGKVIRNISAAGTNENWLNILAIECPSGFSNFRVGTYFDRMHWTCQDIKI